MSSSLTGQPPPNYKPALLAYESGGRGVQHGKWHPDHLNTVNLDGTPKVTQDWKATLKSQQQQTSFPPPAARPTATHTTPSLTSPSFNLPPDVLAHQNRMKQELAQWAKVQMEERETMKKAEREKKKVGGGEREEWMFERKPVVRKEKVEQVGNYVGSNDAAQTRASRIREQYDNTNEVRQSDASHHKRNEKQTIVETTTTSGHPTAFTTQTIQNLTTIPIPPFQTQPQKPTDKITLHLNPISWRPIQTFPSTHTRHDNRTNVTSQLNKDPTNIQNTLHLGLHQRADSDSNRRVKTDVGKLPRADLVFGGGGLKEHLHTPGEKSHCATDPSYFHFGRPGAGAPLLNPVTHNIDAHLRTGNPDKHNAKIADPSYPFGRPGAGAPILNPVTQAVDAHRTGVRRDEKTNQYYETSIANQPDWESRQRQNPNTKQYRNQPPPASDWSFPSDLPYKISHAKHKATDIIAPLNPVHVDPTEATAYHADLDRQIKQQRETAKREKMEDRRLGLQHIQSSRTITGRSEYWPAYVQGKPPAPLPVPVEDEQRRNSQVYPGVIYGKPKPRVKTGKE